MSNAFTRAIQKSMGQLKKSKYPAKIPDQTSTNLPNLGGSKTTQEDIKRLGDIAKPYGTPVPKATITLKRLKLK